MSTTLVILCCYSHLCSQVLDVQMSSTFWDRLYTSESDVCRRHILTYRDSPRTEKNHNGRTPITWVFK